MSLAKSYAKALLEVLQDNQAGSSQMEACEKQLVDFQSLVFGSKELKTALVSPLASVREKATLIGELSQKLSLDPIVVQFLNLLAKKGRLGVLKDISEMFRVVRLAQEGCVLGKICASEGVPQDEIEKLASAFSKNLGKKVTFQVEIDPSLLAGVKVTVNGVTYDGTLRSQLQKLRDRFVAYTMSA